MKQSSSSVGLESLVCHLALLMQGPLCSILPAARSMFAVYCAGCDQVVEL